MIQQSTFLGLSLRTRAQRRWLVVAYYGLLLAIAVVGFVRGKGLAPALLAQTVVLGGMLGGWRAGGPVKPYSEPRAPLSSGVLDDAPIELNLSGRPTRTWGPLPWTPLDERERGQRDHAHYTAYCILVVLMSLAMVPYTFGMLRPQMWLARESSLLFWLLLIVALSLPQSVLLWTEPEESAGEIYALSAPQQ